MFKASGLPASLKGEILCHNYLGWGHAAKDKSGKLICPTAVKPRRPGDCIDGVRLLELRGNSSGSRPVFLADIAISSTRDLLATSPSSRTSASN
eukprot:4202129-Pleurochrysis_carterae.AAC.1